MNYFQSDLSIKGLYLDTSRKRVQDVDALLGRVQGLDMTEKGLALPS